MHVFGMQGGGPQTLGFVAPQTPLFGHLPQSIVPLHPSSMGPHWAPFEAQVMPLPQGVPPSGIIKAPVEPPWPPVIEALVLVRPPAPPTPPAGPLAAPLLEALQAAATRLSHAAATHVYANATLGHRVDGQPLIGTGCAANPTASPNAGLPT
jgi:hypothetical protein